MPMGSIKSRKGKKTKDAAPSTRWLPEPMSLDEIRARPTVSLLDAAAAIGIGRTAAYEMVRKDEFPVRVFKVGSTWRVPTSSLVKFIEG